MSPPRALRKWRETEALELRRCARDAGVWREQWRRAENGLPIGLVAADRIVQYVRGLGGSLRHEDLLPAELPPPVVDEG